MSQKGFSKIIVIIIILVIIGGAILVWQWPRINMSNNSSQIEPVENIQEELFPCIALDIEIGDCTDEITEKSVKIMKDYLANYTPVDLTDAEVIYCSDDEEDGYGHFWVFKTFYLDHWVGIGTVCVTDVVEPLPIEFIKMTKDYRINIHAYKGIESNIMRIADGQVYNADVERRDTELKSVQEAQDELNKYWKLDTPLEIDQNPPYSWEQGYIYSNINRPYTYISVNKYMLDYVSILYRTFDL